MGRWTGVARAGVVHTRLDSRPSHKMKLQGWGDATGALLERGVQASVVGRDLQLGGPRLLEHSKVTVPRELEERSRGWGEQGETVVYLLERDRVIAALAMADVIRPESREAVSALEAMGIRVVMLTGDSEEVARWVAGELGIGTYSAEVLPEHKSEKVKSPRQGGATMGMVGDGGNDAPALAQANVGIAIGAGTDVARAAAGSVLVTNDPRDVVKIVELSRASYSKDGAEPGLSRRLQRHRPAVGRGGVRRPGVRASPLGWRGADVGEHDHRRPKRADPARAEIGGLGLLLSANPQVHLRDTSAVQPILSV